MISGSQISLINPTEPLSVGDTVYVGIGEDRIGTVAFIGETQFATGEWIGVILSSPNGKNDGSVSGVSYFKCKPMHGIFSKRHNIRLAKDSADKLASGECATESAVGFSPGNDIPTDSNCPKTSMDAVAAPAHISSDSSCFQVGDRVQVSGGRTGVLRFLGPTEFAAGEWAGIELDEPLGKNDGSVSGKRYFACKPNFGLFSLASKLHAPGTTVGLCTPQHRRSQESLVSYSSNLSSVSRSYRAQHGLSGNSASYGRTTTPNIRRPTSAMNSNPRGQQANIQSLQRLIKEKEDHISQLLQEREIERSDLARATLDREMAESEILNQRNQIERLNQQLQNMEAVHQLLQDECEQLTLRLHEEKKNLEDLQFRMEEENINKSTLEPRSADEDSRVFELEEALMSAREINEQTEAELARVQAELAALRTAQSNKTSVCPATEKSPLSVEKEHQKGDTQIPSSDDSDPQVRDAKVGSPSKLSLHRVNLVAQASVAPVQMNPDSSLQAECERLRRELADRERITESALKRQADVLEVVTDDFQKQIAELNAQVLASSKELVTSRQECSSIKEQSQVTITELQDEIHRMKCKFTEEESKYKETLSCYQKRIEGLTAQLDSMKGKTSATVMEQSVALRKLEEKLKFTERQLLDYQPGD